MAVAIATALPAYAQDILGSAQLVNVSREGAEAMVSMVRMNGYRCQRVDMVSRCLVDRCFRISCDLSWVYHVYQDPRGGYRIEVNK